MRRGHKVTRNLKKQIPPSSQVNFSSGVSDLTVSWPRTVAVLKDVLWKHVQVQRNDVLKAVMFNQDLSVEVTTTVLSFACWTCQWLSYQLPWWVPQHYSLRWWGSSFGLGRPRCAFYGRGDLAERAITKLGNPVRLHRMYIENHWKSLKIIEIDQASRPFMIEKTTMNCRIAMLQFN